MPSAFAANSYGAESFNVSDEDADIFTQLGANKNIFSIDKSKIPAKYKQYENSAFQVPKGSAISYRALVNTAGDGMLVSNLKNAKVDSATIDFGDGTKKSGTGWISHTYKKAGWYVITVNIYGGCTGYDFFGNPGNGIGKISNGTKQYLIYVADKPQLVLSKISAGYTNKKDYLKGNINFLSIQVTNVGSVSSKATKVSIWYEKLNEFGKVHPSLKKYTASANIVALKSGKSTTVRVYFKIPVKYASLWKNIKLDSANKNLNQISKVDNLYRFR